MTLFLYTLAGTLAALLAWRYLDRVLNWFDPRLGRGFAAARSLARRWVSKYPMFVFAPVLALVGGAIMGTISWLLEGDVRQALVAAGVVFAAIGVEAFGRYSKFLLSFLFLVMFLGLWIGQTIVTGGALWLHFLGLGAVAVSGAIMIYQGRSLARSGDMWWPFSRTPGS